MSRTAAERKRPIVVPSAVRKWARAQGYDVGQRGRIAESLMAEYRAAKRRHPSAHKK